MSKIKKNVLINVLVVLMLTGLQTHALAKEGVMHRLARAVFAVPKAILNSMSGPTPCEADCENENINIHFPYFNSASQSYGQNLYYIAPPYSLTNQAPNYVTYQVVIPRQTQKFKDRTNVHIYSSIPFENR